MVYISSTPIKRTKAQKVVRSLLGVVAVALIVFILSRIPYDILREERFRIFGETHTTGVVLEVGTVSGADDSSRFVIQYKYVDTDGYAHRAEAPLPRETWERFYTGSRVEVIYAASRPGLARVPGEIEPPFQIWLRGLLH